MKPFFRWSLCSPLRVLLCFSCCIRPTLSFRFLNLTAGSLYSGDNVIQIRGEHFFYECLWWEDDALSCFTFNLTQVRRQFLSARLLFHKQENSMEANTNEMLLYDLGPLEELEERIGKKIVISRVNVSTNASLVNIDLTDVVKNWTTPVSDIRIMAFKYSKCASQYCHVFVAEGERRPSIVIVYSELQLLRRQLNLASPQCDPTMYCCLTDYIVTFSHIDLPWFIAPTTINIKRCNGVCTDLMASENFNGYLLTRDQSYLRWKRPGLVGATLCCAPTGYRKQSFLYFDDNDMIRLQRVEVQVTSCSCI